MIKISCSQAEYQLLKRADQASPGTYLHHSLSEDEINHLVDNGLMIRLNQHVRITDQGRKFVQAFDR